jgi:hypothetical protein
VFNGVVGGLMAVDFPTRWEFGLGMAMMGTGSPAETLRRFQALSLDSGRDIAGLTVLERIKCPVLAIGASKSVYASAEESTIAIYEALKQLPENEKEVWIPRHVEEGGITGKVGSRGVLAKV